MARSDFGGLQNNALRRSFTVEHRNALSLPSSVLATRADETRILASDLPGPDDWLKRPRFDLAGPSPQQLRQVSAAAIPARAMRVEAVQRRIGNERVFVHGGLLGR